LSHRMRRLGCRFVVASLLSIAAPSSEDSRYSILPEGGDDHDPAYRHEGGRFSGVSRLCWSIRLRRRDTTGRYSLGMAAGFFACIRAATSNRRGGSSASFELTICAKDSQEDPEKEQGGECGSRPSQQLEDTNLDPGDLRSAL
jgi:hypothetical protein